MDLRGLADGRLILYSDADHARCTDGVAFYIGAPVLLISRKQGVIVTSN